MSELPHPLLATAAARPSHRVVEGGGQGLTARQLVARVARRAGALGARPGEVVALSGPRSVDWVVALHAIGWCGAVARPLSPGLPEAARDALLQGAHHRVGRLPGAQPLALDGPEVAAATWPLASPRLEVVTSGTTGTPRLVPLTTEQLVFSAMGSALRLGHLPTDRWVMTLPLHHVGGLSILLRCAWYATTVQLHPHFDAAAVSEALDAGATHVSLVPTMLDRLLEVRAGRRFGPHVRCLLVGGAPTTAAQRDRAKALGAPVALTWGMTEAASQLATGRPGVLDAAVPPLPFVDIHADRDGTLVARGPTVGGELATADRGRMVDGRVQVLGRADDVIVSGGENIDPAEVEAVLRAHPAVAAAAVAGRPDPRWGARPHAWLVAAAGAVPPDDDELRRWVQGRLEPFKAPDRVYWVTALPRNELGKVVRRELTPAATPT